MLDEAYRTTVQWKLRNVYVLEKVTWFNSKSKMLGQDMKILLWKEFRALPSKENRK